MKVRITSVLAAIASAPFIYVSNQGFEYGYSELKRVELGNNIAAEQQHLLKLHYAHKKSITADGLTDHRDSSSEIISELTHHYSRYRSDEFGRTDESLSYSSSSKVDEYKPVHEFTGNNYQAWASAIRKEYPGVHNRIKAYQFALEQFPNNHHLQADYVTLLSWNQQYRTAVKFYRDHLRASELPLYALNAVALSARESEHYKLSRKLYSQALSNEPGNIDSLLGISALDLRQGRLKKAEIRIQDVLRKEPENKEARELLAYLYNQQQNKEIEKIKTYEQLLSDGGEQGSAEFKRLRTLNLLELGAVEVAANEMSSKPQDYLAEDWLKLRSMQNTKAIRRVAGSGKGINNKALVDRALRTNQDYIEFLESTGTANQQTLATAYADKILLKSKLNRHLQAAELASKQSELMPLMPDYGLLALADSYQALHYPEKSLHVINKGFASGQIAHNNSDAMKLAYYAALDMGNVDEAETYLSKLAAEQPKWRYSKDKSRRKANTEYGDAALMQIMHRAFTNDLGGAEAGLVDLLEKAPQNNEYRQNYADVLRWRGFVDKSQQQVEIIKATDPDYEPSLISQTYNLIAHRQYKAARLTISDLQKGRMRSAVERLADDYDIAVSPKVELSLSGGNSDGSSFSSKDRNYEVRAYSQLLDDHWRFFASLQSFNSSFFNQDESTATQGLGVSYESRWFKSELELYNVEEFGDTALAASYEWIPEDFISLKLSHQTFNKQTPVRAIYSDIKSDLSQVVLTYRHDEKQSYTALWQSSNFSDGNSRSSYSLYGSQVVYQDFDDRLTLSESFYSERNSLDSDRFYFNPSSSLGMTMSLSYEQMLYKHANTDFWHGLVTEYGFYDQEGFVRGDVGSISYFHRWQINKRSFLNYSVGYNRRIYDGLTETGPAYSLSYGVTL